jgi:hypothetical protein
MKDFHRDSVVYCRIRNAKPRLVAPITLVSREDSNSPAEKNFLELAKSLRASTRPESVAHGHQNAPAARGFRCKMR